MENKRQFFEKVADYFLGEHNQELLKEELENTSESKELFQWVNFLWTILAPKADHSEKIKEFTNKKIDPKPRSMTYFYLGVVKYVAIILLTFVVGGVAYFYLGQDIQYVEVVSGVGQVKVVEMPDGSKAWLNTKSSLKYPESFKGRLREVSMDGEVYFEVAKDKEHPFVVSLEHVNVRVLGTSFMVSSYFDEPTIGTYLAEGRIEMEIKESGKTLDLIPGDEVLYSKESKVLTKENNFNSVLDSWRFGKISFYNESFYEIARKLERKFGKEIKISDEQVGEMKLTADFESESLEQIMTFLCEVSGVKFSKNENTYLISNN